MAITIDELVYSVGLDDSDMRAGANRIEKTIKGLSQFTAGLTGAFAFPLQMVGGFEALGEAIGRAGKAVVDFSREATVFNTVERSFQNLAASAGQSGNAILSAMQDATVGTVDSLTLMQQANQALLLGLEVTPERMTQLMQIARSSAQSTGQEFSYMVESIIGGLGRQEREILDNLGIVVRADDANAKYAESIGKTAKELTEAERKQAFMNEALRIGMENLERAGGVQTSATEKFQRMDVAVTELQLSIGRLFAPATSGLLSTFATGISSLADGLAQLPPLFESTQDKADRLSQTFRDLHSETTDQLATITDLQEEYNQLNERLDDENLTAEEAQRLHNELNRIIKQMSTSVPGLAAVFRQYGNDVSKVNEHINRSKELHRELLEGTAQQTGRSLRQAYQEAVKSAAEAQSRLETMQADYARRLEMSAEDWRKAYDDVARVSEEGATRLYGFTYQEFRNMLRQQGEDLQKFEQDIVGMNAEVALQARKLGGFVELYGLKGAVEGMNQLNRAAFGIGRLTGENAQKMADYQARIRDAFGLGREEGAEFADTLRKIYQSTADAPAPALEEMSAAVSEIADDWDGMWKRAEAAGKLIAARNATIRKDTAASKKDGWEFAKIQGKIIALHNQQVRLLGKESDELREQIDHSLDLRIQNTARENAEREIQRSIEFQNKQLEKQVALLAKGSAWAGELQANLAIPQTYNVILQQSKELADLDWTKNIVEGVEEAESVWDDFISGVQGGLEGLGIEMDGLIGQAFDFVQAMASQDFVSAWINGIGLVKNALNKAFPAGFIGIDTSTIQSELETARQIYADWADDIRKPSSPILEAIINEHDITKLDAHIKGLEKRIELRTMGIAGILNNTKTQTQQIWADMFDPDKTIKDPLAHFTQSLEQLLFQEVMNILIAQSAISDRAKRLGETLAWSLEDGIISATEKFEIDKQTAWVKNLFNKSTQQFEQAVNALGIEFERTGADALMSVEDGFTKAKDDARSRRETEAFQTISNITRFQANQMIAQLSLHSNYLQSIANTNLRIAELSDTIAKNTQNIGRLQQSTVNNGLDEIKLANQQLNQRQAQGLQI